MNPLLIPLIAEGVALVLDLLREARTQKRQAARLSRVAIAWEQTGRLKDALIQLYESQAVTEENRLEAIALGEQLQRLQRLLRDIRRAIAEGESATREFAAAEDSAESLLKQIIRF